MDLVAAEKGWISPLYKSKRSSSQPPAQSPPLVCSRCLSRERGGAGGTTFRSAADETYFLSTPRHSTPTTHTKRSSSPGGRKGSRESLERVSAKELLGASLHSLEQLQRQRQRGGGGAQQDPEDPGAYPHSILEDSYGTPSAEYLKGAIWLGRNLHMVTEDLVEQLDFFRTKYLREVSALSRGGAGDGAAAQSAAGGGGSSSTSHRLSLLAASGITDAMTIAYKARTRSRKMLQQASSLTPGDQEGMRSFLLDLPIESMLTTRGLHD